MVETYIVLDECLLTGKFKRVYGIDKPIKDNAKACEELTNFINRRFDVDKDKILCVSVSDTGKREKIYREKYGMLYIDSYKKLVNHCEREAKKKGKSPQEIRHEFKACLGDDNNIIRFLAYSEENKNPLSAGVSDVTIRRFAESLAKETEFSCDARVVILTNDRDEELESQHPCVDRIAIKPSDSINRIEDEIEKKLSQFLSRG